MSPATVSFVLNETPGQVLREETRDRVRAAAKQLHYQPHRIARALRAGSSPVVLLDIGPIWGGHILDGFVQGMRDELVTEGLTLLVRRGDEAPLDEMIDAVAPRAFVGLPSEYTGGSHSGRVEIEEGGRLDGLAAHAHTQLGFLARLGHRHIAVATPATSDASARRIVDLRLQHAAAVRSELGLTQITELPLTDSPEHDRATVAALLSDTPEITAVAALDDMLAMRTLRAADDLGIDVPADLAVIGFGNSAVGSLWKPALTTVEIDAVAFGHRAARLALGKPVGEFARPASRVIVREST